MEGAFQLFKSAREYLTPVLTESVFLEKGMLTPEEFVRAGDQLVANCPSWRWESGEASKQRPYLPPNKQFLATDGVPSYHRVSSLAGAELDEDVERAEEGAEGKPGNDDFVDVNSASISDEWASVRDPQKSLLPPAPLAKAATPAAASSHLDLEEEGLELDAATADPCKGEEDHLLSARRYDVSITYDNYYRTPRIWLFGYDESGSVLSPEAIFEDVIQDYAKRTVTIDPHPHLSAPHASIHPCQHAPAMLTIIKALQESGVTPTVDKYFFIFLKFIQSVVPTIEYDYTSDVQLS
eukprot:gene6618-7311_t